MSNGQSKQISIRCSIFPVLLLTSFTASGAAAAPLSSPPALHSHAGLFTLPVQEFETLLTWLLLLPPRRPSQVRIPVCSGCHSVRQHTVHKNIAQKIPNQGARGGAVYVLETPALNQRPEEERGDTNGCSNWHLIGGEARGLCQSSGCSGKLGTINTCLTCFSATLNRV